MDQQDQDKGAAARSYGKECKRQAADLMVSKRQVVETGVHQTSLFWERSK